MVAETVASVLPAVPLILDIVAIPPLLFWFYLFKLRGVPGSLSTFVSLTLALLTTLAVHTAACAWAWAECWRLLWLEAVEDAGPTRLLGLAGVAGFETTAAAASALWSGLVSGAGHLLEKAAGLAGEGADGDGGGVESDVVAGAGPAAATFATTRSSCGVRSWHASPVVGPVIDGLVRALEAVGSSTAEATRTADAKHLRLHLCWESADKVVPALLFIAVFWSIVAAGNGALVLLHVRHWWRTLVGGKLVARISGRISGLLFGGRGRGGSQGRMQRTMTSAGPRGPPSEGTVSNKKVLYFRHGQSTGNAWLVRVRKTVIRVLGWLESREERGGDAVCAECVQCVQFVE